MVTVNSGAISYLDKPEDVPVDKWDLLMGAKRYYMSVSLTADCRYLVRFVAEAEVMYKQLGYDSVSQMIAEGYELDPDEIRIAKEWLEINEPDAAVGIDDVIQMARDNPLRPEVGRPEGNNDRNTNIKPRTQDKTYTLRRLARDNPELLDRVESGELSANAAAIEAGFRRKMISVPGDNYDDAIAAVKKYYKQ